MSWHRAKADAKVSTKAATQVAALETAAAQEDNDLKLSQKSLLTDDIAKADHDRDLLFGGYKRAMKGFLNLPVENLAQAAKVLNQHIIDYDIDPQGQLDKETGTVGKLHRRLGRQVFGTSRRPLAHPVRHQPERSQRACPHPHRRPHGGTDDHCRGRVESIAQGIGRSVPHAGEMV